MNFKRDGFFVEFGATNGLDLSNTHLLEKDFGWTGILAEPAVCWHRDLKRNRNAHIETRCVWKYSNASLAFNETEMEELSTLAEFSSTDAYGELRKKGRTYNVDTISLNDLLTKYGAPIDIDYLSIDTEGSEFEILKNFDFSMHQFKVITCEHNFTPVRSQLFELLTRNGYVRKFEDLSRFDDWYVRAG
jgi:FkbM family methyltransferase